MKKKKTCDQWTGNAGYYSLTGKATITHFIHVLTASPWHVSQLASLFKVPMHASKTCLTAIV